MAGLATKHALITGAGNGLGRSLAVHLASRGWHIGIADFQTGPAETTRRLVEQAGGTAEVHALDVRDELQWQLLSDKLRQRWPTLDLLVNNAGVSASGEVGQSTIADWDWVLAVNLRGVILGCHTMVDWLRANPDRSYILNIASAAALLCGPGMAAYNVSKAGVVALSQSMFVELRKHNVGVTVACPWFIQTDLLKNGRFATSSQKGFAEKAMAKARLTPEDFARIALDATFRRKAMVVPGRRPRWATTARRLFPQTFMTLLERYIRRLPDESPTDNEAPVATLPENSQARPVNSASEPSRNKETALS